MGIQYQQCEIRLHRWAGVPAQERDSQGEGGAQLLPCSHVT